MAQAWHLEDIIATIKQDLLLDKLDLANGGVTLADIQDDTPLIDEGLALDSVDALDLLVAAEKTFGIKLPDPDKAFIERTCKDVGTLARYIASELASQDTRASA
ncbi:hypothetical protein ANDA3_2304 [plant metagenome]|uniref:Carrier domain-containing protein n=2 Tax=root TaxID=1 RepID=A0A1C3JXF6_9BURK|nr:phosphopantetheine-binding protein [Orrella dioscoreae]SBT23798.1 hypothetical protein ODI_01180 [Orrella dioscoreae]SOE49712.1 hypothetical protein ODI_R2264 [Orrella dioscoreae]